MKADRASGRWPGPEYQVHAVFRAPMRFAFRWCTDFSSEDPQLERDDYERKIIARSPRRVVFEDLEETKDGWNWARKTVRLQPPNRWAMESVGNRTDVRAEYRLSELPGGRTQFELRWWRRAKRPPLMRMTKSERERSTTIAWRRFAAALARDYRRSRRTKRA
jgi:hypothetical protein